MAGDETCALAFGLDQLGHFGPRCVSLVVERLVQATAGPLTHVLEVGSGFGGALRQVERELRSRKVDASLVGVELVAEHCANAAAISGVLADPAPRIVQADARRLPLRSGSMDAVFAAGSASHFSSIRDVLAECGRVLRPGGVLVMTEEVSVRPAGGPEPGDEFVQHHPRDVFHAATPEERRDELTAAALMVEAFEPLVRWAVPLLRQRVQALRFMAHCAMRMFGEQAYERMVRTLTSAADEYERGSIEPVLVVARRVGS
jgi:SAM-dependent methyltransferase